MKKRSSSLLKILFLLLFVFSFSIGYSNWLYDLVVSMTVNSVEEKIVCELRISSGETIKYTDLTSAIKKGEPGDSIYVYPGLKNSDNTIYEIPLKTCTLKCDLYMPYDATNLSNVQNRAGSSSDFADSTETKVKANRVTLITLEENCVFTIEGGKTVYIGGTLGGTGTGLNGHTSGVYTEISLKENSQIINKGIIDCFGYIKEYGYEDNGSIVINESGSKIKAPLVVYDFNGGTYTVTKCYSVLSGLKICPFSVFDVPNIKCRVRYKYNSYLTGYCDLYASSKHNYTEGNIIGVINSLIIVKDKNSYIENKYYANGNDFNLSYFKSPKCYNALDFYGNIEIGSLSLTVTAGFTATINTSDVCLPISYKFKINVKSGTTYMPHDIKFINGSELTVSAGATAKFGGEAQFYTHTWTDTKAVPYMVGSSTIQEGYEKAVLKVYGNIIFQSASGGIYDVYSGSASLSLGSTVSVSPKEFDMDANDIYTDTESAIGKTGTDLSYTNLTSGYFYVGKLANETEYYWYVGDEVRGQIKYSKYMDGAYVCDLGTASYDLTTNSNVNLLANENIDGYVFDKYTYIDENGEEIDILGNTINGAIIIPNVTLEDSVYTIYVRLYYKKAYKTTINYYGYDGTTLISSDIVINGTSVSLLEEYDNYYRSDTFDVNQTVLHKYEHLFIGWENMSDSNEIYGSDCEYGFEYSAPELEEDKVLNLKARYSSNVNNTINYYRVNIKNDSIRYNAFSNRRWVYGILQLANDDFENNGVNLTNGSTEDNGLSNASFTYFVKENSSITIMLRKGYSGIGKYSISMYVNDVLHTTGSPTSVVTGAVSVKETITITGKAN